MRMVNGVARLGAGVSERPHRGQGACVQDIAPLPGSRSLVAVRSVRASARPLGLPERPQAPFLAQLIAAAQHAPQLRVRRRARPGEVIGAYAAGLDAGRTIPPGRVLRRIA
jgi:hypothetical protein